MDAERAAEEAAISADASLAQLLHDIAGGNAPAVLTLRVSPLGARALAKALQQHVHVTTGIRSIDFSGCDFGDDVGLELGRALEGGAQFVRLELDYNRLGPASLISLAAGMSTRGNQLRFLSLERNPVTGTASAHAASSSTAGSATQSGGVGGARPPSVFAPGSTTTTAASNSAIAAVAAPAGDLSGVQALATALASPHCVLQHLNLFGTGIGAAGGSILARCLMGRQNQASSGSRSASSSSAKLLSLLQVQLSPHDGVLDNDRATIAEALSKTAAALAAASASTAASVHAEEERRAVEDARDSAEAGAAAEIAWVEQQASSRAAVRREAEYVAWKAERKAELAREIAHKERGIKLAAEAATAAVAAEVAKAKKSAKAKKG